MNAILPVVVFVISSKNLVNSFPDLIPEAVTVYRNPDFFKNLNYDAKIKHVQEPTKTNEGLKKYNYPGETKKKIPLPGFSIFEVNYDNSPEFHHEPRDIFVNTAPNPRKKKGPYRPRYNGGSTNEPLNWNVSKPVQETGSEEGHKEFRENAENKNGEEPRDFVSVFNENLEEFTEYHEPILLARPNFDPAKSSKVGSSVYNQPYPYNKTTSILYEEWKHYAYPKIHANEHLKSNSKIFSKDLPSNFFEDEPSYYYTYDDETEDASNFFESKNYKNLGADTKQIYKKLLKPKKSFLFKFHSKPKFKKIKLQLKKKHSLKPDWFDEYPFDF